MSKLRFGITYCDAIALLLKFGWQSESIRFLFLSALTIAVMTGLGLWSANSHTVLPIAAFGHEIDILVVVSVTVNAFLIGVTFYMPIKILSNVAILKAIHCQDERLMAALFKTGLASQSTRNGRQETLLMQCVFRDNKAETQIIRFLLNCGADVSHVNCHGQTAMEIMRNFKDDVGYRLISDFCEYQSLVECIDIKEDYLCTADQIKF